MKTKLKWVLLWGSCWASTGMMAQTNGVPPVGCTGDLDWDGQVNLNDLIVMLAHYGTSCPIPEPVQPAALWISEIHYNPSTLQGDDSIWEFIELHNPGNSAIALSGWTVGNAVNLAFPSGAEIAPLGFAVLCRNVDSLLTLVPPGVPCWAWTATSSLNNTGETIEVYRADGTLADEVAYEDNDGWMVAPDGGGPSLEWMDVGLNNDEAASWAASFVLGGTPGRANSMWGLGDPE